MFPPSRRSAVALLPLVWISSTSAISLSNFTPKVIGLSNACEKVYESTISGCRADDFRSNEQCSQSCVNGLIAIAQSVSSACSNDNVPDNSIVGVTLLGQLIPALCNGLQVTTISSNTQESTTTKAQTTTQISVTLISTSTNNAGTSDGIIMDTSAPPPPAASSTTFATSTTETTTTETTTTVTSAQAPPPTSVNSAATSTTTESSTSTSKAKSSSTSSSQKSNSDSGGGSPFDVQAVSGSRSSAVTASIASCVAALSLVFFVAA